MHARAKTDRIWIQKLKSLLGTEIFEHLIHRMLKGDSLRALAHYCHHVNSNYSYETYRKWLRILDRNTVSRRREETLTQQAIQAFNASKEKTTSPAAPTEPEAPSEEGYRWLKRNVTKTYKNIDTENMLKFLWIMGQKRLDRVMAIEERTGLPYPDGHKIFGELTKVAVAHMQFEFRVKSLKRDDGEAIDISSLDPEVQKFAQLDVVDRNLIHELRKRFLKMVAEDIEDETIAEGLESDAPGTAGTQAS